jgi:hypothetical protein
MSSSSLALKIVGTSIALSSLFFFGVFRELLFPSSFRSWAVDIPSVEYSALVICVFLLALVFATVLVLLEIASNKREQKQLQLLFLVMTMASFGALSHEISMWLWSIEYSFSKFLLPLVVGSLCVAWAFQNTWSLGAVVSNMRSMSSLLAPFAIFLLIQIAVLWAYSEPKTISSTPKEYNGPNKVDPGAKGRILWIIFDELDLAALTHRPANIPMPSFEKLMTEALVAENAFAPASDTKESIHGLIYGRPITPPVSTFIGSFMSLRSAEYWNYFRNVDNNVISDVSAVGRKSGVAGWYIPYRRVFGNAPAFGDWEWERKKSCDNLFDCIFDTFSEAFQKIPVGNPFGDLVGRETKSFAEATSDRHQLQLNVFLLEGAGRLIRDREIDLLLLHFAVPHAPLGYRKGEQTAESYCRSLQIADGNLGRIRELLEETGEWQRSNLIVSSDHWWRAKPPYAFDHLPEDERQQALDDTRIPFIVKLAGQNIGEKYKKPFNTVVTRYLISEIFRGEVRTADDLVRWLDNMADRQPELINFRPLTAQVQ